MINKRHTGTLEHPNTLPHTYAFLNTYNNTHIHTKPN
jgi:hypothetical protein